MTTQAMNLPGRIPAGAVRVQRPDKSTYVEHDEAEVARMIAAGIVEGVGPRSGRIDILRITVSEAEAMAAIAIVRSGEAPSIEERPGSIMSMASLAVFRESLDDGHFVWQHKRNRNAFQAREAACA